MKWVVTYKLFTEEGSLIIEFYRGSREECQRIKARSHSGEDDRRGGLHLHECIVGPAHEWDDFLVQAAQMPGVETMVMEAR